MMKFFRKYNKHLLAVFMVLLMVVFVGGQALENMLTPRSNIAVAESHLGLIELAHQRHAQNITNILSSMGMNWRQPAGGATKPIELVDWILLTREAEKFNTQASPAAIQAFLGGAAGQQRIDSVARALRIKSEHILEAVGDLLSVQMAAGALASVTVPSTSVIRSVAQETLEKVTVNAVLLPAEAFVDPEAEFSTEKMEAQWSAFQDREPGPGLNFGYYVPPRLSVQYVRIDRDAIMNQVRIANLERKAQRYFEENRETDRAFARPAEEIKSPEEEGPDAEETSAESEEAKTEKSPFLGWDEAKEAAIEIVRRQHADEAAAKIANWLLQYDAEQWFDVQRERNGYKPAPERVATLDYYGRMLERVPAAIAYPEAVSVAQTEHFSEGESEGVPEIGKANYRPESGRWSSLADLAFRTQGVVPEIPLDAGGERADYLASFQTCPYALRDENENVYVFRVVDVNPAHPAESVDEVRDRVIDDLRLLQGLEVAKARAEGLRSCSPEVTIQEAFESDAELVELKSMGLGVGFFESPPVTRYTLMEAATGQRNPNRRVGFEIGEIPSEIIDQWFELEDAWERTAVYELQDRATIIVAEWVETEPAREDQFQQQRERIFELLTDRRQRESLADWFDPDQIRIRNGFELIN